MTFKELNLSAPLLRAVQEAGYETPSPIQAAAIPPVLAGRDLMGCAQTGTGKTAAFALPMLDRLTANAPRRKGAVRALILTPTRELALQIGESFEAYGKYLKLRSTVIFGGVGQAPQVEALKKGVDILIACPGRLNDLIGQGFIDLSDLEIFVMDEADRMLDMGFAQDIEHIAGETRWRNQTMLFSATLEGEAIKDFAERLLEDPVEVSATPSTRERKKIHQWYYRADNLEHKVELLKHLLKQEDALRTIVFVRKRERVHELAEMLRNAGINNCYLEGEMAQIKRTEGIKRLTDGRVNVLVATDVAARGIDIPDVSHVINFDMPRSGDTYLHRIGRTGRAGRKGIAISLVEAHDYLLLQKIGRYVDEPLKARVIDGLRPTTRAPSEKMTGKPSKKALAKRAERKEKEKEKPRVKQRHRDTKNIGKRRKPSSAAPETKTEE